MLTLLIKKKWFDMIRSGEKKEEYREIKPYYTTRFIKWMGYPKAFISDDNEWFFNSLADIELDRFTDKIKLRNGYSSNAPELICECSLRIGYGKAEWGAEPNKKYFILEIHKIIE